tara:strand:- start:5666 stop:7195 length:1530 start_codon:yes stop_codon:yes gene_type:complete
MMPAGQLVSTTRSLPPPVGGWDTRESLADMPETHAIILDNFFPLTDKVGLRRGHSSHVTGMTAADVETLIEYVPKTGSGQLFAANSGGIYNVTAAGAVGAAVSSGHSNNRWQHVNLGTSAGQFVRLFNGTDTPLLYDGSTWATTAITGPTAANLIWGNLHQRRLWVGEEDSLSAWYLAANAVSGAATEFSLAGIARLGGYIMAMGTWTRDAGDGMDDVACFYTSEGEVIVYAGTDPSDATLWSLVGVFRIGKPIGRRCFVKAGSDLILVTQDGFVPLSGILTLDRSQTRLVALSDQIAQAVNTAVRLYGTNFGWQPILYPRGTMLIFNIPISSLKSHQYVFNTLTGAPSRFTGINAVCFGMLNDELYFGGHDGVVYKFDDGTSDNTANIEADAMQAFSYFGQPNASKAFKEIEPIFQSDGNPNAAIDLNVDFQKKQPTGVAAASAVSAGTWGISKWGIGRWGTADQVYSGWRGVRGVGRAASTRIRINTTTANPNWVATNVRYIPGGQV